jgi:D-alanine-D-alanine ligase-like ATP-grasp enzyme
MVVDNGASGGLLCKLSEQGTIVYSLDKKERQSYTHHPTTNHPLIGFTIPRWEEAKALALQLALHIPSVRYCGWDLALTANGWIMIEGNEAAELTGIHIFGGGCKSALKKYI